MHNLLHCTSLLYIYIILILSLVGYYKSEKKIEKKTATKSIEGKAGEEEVEEECNYLPFLLVMEHYKQSQFN